jgi:hypothetical protein
VRTPDPGNPSRSGLELLVYCCYSLFMAHSLRIEYPGALYHATSRGNAKDKIFNNNKDKEYFLDLHSFVVSSSG